MIESSRVHRALARAVPVTAQEVSALLWSFAYFFCLLAGYYVLRPLRDQMGIAGGVRNLPWLFTATFVTLLALQPVYGALVARLARSRFIPIVYHFFILNLIAFWLLLTLDVQPVFVARVFFVWVSVFNLFAVTVFWSFMADLFTSPQGKRLFGFIGAGGTAGSVLGPLVTLGLAGPLGVVNLLLIAAVFLEACVLCVHRLARLSHRAPHLDAARGEERVGGGAFEAIPEVMRSPYLLGITIWVALLSFGGTILYYQQANIVAATIPDRVAQTRLFAGIDLAVSVLTLTIQVVATGKFIARFGVAIAAATLPALYVFGFGAITVVPTLAVVVTLQVLQRTLNFAIANPARQVFFTVLTRSEKYKAKNLIDVVVVRGADAVWGWMFEALQSLGVKLGVIAAIAIPVAIAWTWLSVVLGRSEERRARTMHVETEPQLAQSAG